MKEGIWGMEIVNSVFGEQNKNPLFAKNRGLS
jgi:hypothetical protein